MTLNVAKQFSKSLGGKLLESGPNSGEEFYVKHLEPAYYDAYDHDTKLEVDLDGIIGYPKEFIKGSFCRLASKWMPDNVLNTVQFKSKDKNLVNESTKMMKDSGV